MDYITVGRGEGGGGLSSAAHVTDQTVAGGLVVLWQLTTTLELFAKYDLRSTRKVPDLLV